VCLQVPQSVKLMYESRAAAAAAAGTEAAVVRCASDAATDNIGAAAAVARTGDVLPADSATSCEVTSASVVDDGPRVESDVSAASQSHKQVHAVCVCACLRVMLYLN